MYRFRQSSVLLDAKEPHIQKSIFRLPRKWNFHPKLGKSYWCTVLHTVEWRMEDFQQLPVIDWVSTDTSFYSSSFFVVAGFLLVLVGWFDVTRRTKPPFPFVMKHSHSIVIRRHARILMKHPSSLWSGKTKRPDGMKIPRARKGIRAHANEAARRRS